MSTPTTTISGLISGLDTNSIIDQLMTVERRPIDLLQKQIDRANQQKTAFTTINTSLLALKTAVDSLSRIDTWDAKTTSVSDASIFSATATSITPAGTYTFTVTQLAAATQLGSNSFAEDDPVGAGSLDVTVGIGGDARTETIDVSADDTLQDVANAINNKDMGVSAVVVNTGQGATPYKLVLTSTSTGEDNATSIDNNTSGLSFTELTAAKNSAIEFGLDSPIEIQSATNTVTGLAPGLTLNLTALSATPVTATVVADKASLTQQANDFVSKYNAVMDNIAKYTKYDTEKEEAAALFGNSTLRFLQSDLARMIGSVVSSQPAETNSLTMVGFSLNSTGKLSLDTSAFQSALDSYPDGVAGLFSAISDVALSSAGGSISAPAADTPPNFDANNLINGNTDSDDFGDENGFQTAVSPAIFTIDFDRTRSISQLILNTINSDAMPAGDYGVSDFVFRLRTPSGSWTDVKTVSAFASANYYYNLDLPMQATGLQVEVTGTNALDGKIRLLELSANEEDGVAHQVSNMLSLVTRGVDGQIATEQSSLDGKIESLQKQIDAMEERMTAKEARLRAEFTAMETAMSQMQTQSQQFLAQMNSVSSQS